MFDNNRLRRRVLKAAIVIPVIFASIAIAGAISVCVLQGQFGAKYSPVLERGVAIVSAATPYLVPVDPAVTATEAGHIFQAISYSQRQPGQTDRDGVQPVSPALRGSLSAAKVPDLTFARRHPVGGPLITASDAKSDLLADYASEPRRTRLPDGTDLWSRLASAAEADIVGTRYAKFSGGMDGRHLAYAYLAPFKASANVRRAEVGRAIAEGRNADAERISKEILSVGRLWYIEAPNLLESLVGADISRIGVESLEATYRARGDSTAARQVRAVLAAKPDARLAAIVDDIRPSWRFLRGKHVLALAGTPNVPRSLFVDMSSLPRLGRVCTSFPIQNRRPSFADRLRPLMMRRPSEEAWFQAEMSPGEARNISDWPSSLRSCAHLTAAVMHDADGAMGL